MKFASPKSSSPVRNAAPAEATFLLWSVPNPRKDKQIARENREVRLREGLARPLRPAREVRHARASRRRGGVLN